MILTPILIALGLTVLSPLLGFLGIFAAFIALFLVMLFTAFLPFVFVEEGIYGWEGIRRSYELVSTDWVAVLAVVLLGGLPLAIMSLLLSGVWITALLSALYVPLPVAVLAFLYLDIRRDRGELF